MPDTDRIPLRTTELSTAAQLAEAQAAAHDVEVERDQFRAEAHRAHGIAITVERERDEALSTITDAWAALNAAGYAHPVASVADLIRQCAVDRDSTASRLNQARATAHALEVERDDLRIQLHREQADGRAMMRDRDEVIRERDKAREQLDNVTADLDHAQSVADRLREQLRANGTLLTRLRDLAEQADRAWAAHDTVGEPAPADNPAVLPAVLRAAARDLRLLADDHAADSLGFGIGWAADRLDAWADNPDDDGTAERDDCERLADAMERAESVRIDTRDVIWRTAPDGRWQHPLYGLHTLDEIHDKYGQTCTALMLATEPEDEEEEVGRCEHDVSLDDECRQCLIDTYGPDAGDSQPAVHAPSPGSGPARALDVAERLAAALTSAVRQMCITSHPGEPCLRTGWVRVTEVDEWRAALAEYADLAKAATLAQIERDAAQHQAAVAAGRVDDHLGGPPTGYHVTRGTGPSDLEATCPCPKAPCGYVVRTAEATGCELHGPSETMRGGHFAASCPANSPASTREG
ncbi:hypothetical protein [Micromonospora sp. S-DT3-3-22]|uniref:hypothetical protein n=1 Tax=Micromonospora sp. S-DT3-3-22 TaxID=2755359 RepID=UPI00188EF36B|nr:hypothetical protein [Micromonospora sp. S-DT3-3-22]